MDGRSDGRLTVRSDAGLASGPVAGGMHAPGGGRAGRPDGGGGGLVERAGSSGELEPSGLRRTGRSTTSTEGRGCALVVPVDVSGVGRVDGPSMCATSESSSDSTSCPECDVARDAFAPVGRLARLPSRSGAGVAELYSDFSS